METPLTIMSDRVYIALGSNLHHPRTQLMRAIDAIAALPNVTLLQTSPFYETKPMGYAAQDNFMNAVVRVMTSLTPFALLDALQTIERAQGRLRDIKNGPRTIDCDILLFGEQVLNTPTLTLPHPGLTTRDFVLRPLLDISPDYRLPDGQPLQSFFDTLTVRYCETELAELSC